MRRLLAALIAQNWGRWTTAKGASPAYEQTVPPVSRDRATVNMIGGKSVVLNQKVDSSKFYYRDDHGLAISDNMDGGVKLNGTSTAEGYTEVATLNNDSSGSVVAGHKYLFAGFSYLNGLYAVSTTPLQINYSISSDIILSAVDNGGIRFYIRARASSTYNNDVFYPTVIDLTQMFGSAVADTITTPEQAYALGCPREYIPFNPGEIVSADVTEVESRGADDGIIDTLTIPAAVRALEGYGWSAGNVYNEVDFVRKKFIKRVARVDLGTLTWTKEAAVTSGACFYSRLTDRKTGSYVNAVCADLSVSTGPVSGFPVENHAFNFVAYHDTDNIYVRYDELSTAAEFKAAMSGVMLYYELAESVEIDISDLLTDAPLIDVEGGGTLTFKQQSGGLELPVPNDVDYTVNLDELSSLLNSQYQNDLGGIL